MCTIERVPELKAHLMINKADRPLRQIMTEPARVLKSEQQTLHRFLVTKKL